MSDGTPFPFATTKRRRDAEARLINRFGGDSFEEAVERALEAPRRAAESKANFERYMEVWSRLQVAESILSDFERAPCLSALLGEDDGSGCFCFGCQCRSYARVCAARPELPPLSRMVVDIQRETLHDAATWLDATGMANSTAVELLHNHANEKYPDSATNPATSARKSGANH
jgi:hypothetical protein